MIKYFLCLLARPKKTIEAISKANIKTMDIILFLFSLGLVRGLLEVLWLFTIKHRLIQLSFLSRQASWYLLEAGPFILANILTAYFRWAMYSLIFSLSLGFVKIRVDFSRALKVFSVIMGLYVLAGLINFIHYFLGLSMVKFYISEAYAPLLGIGQLISSGLLIFFSYKFSRYLGADKLCAFLTALLIFGSDRFFYFFSAWVYLRLPLAKALSYRNMFNLSSHLVCLVSILLTVLFLRLGFKINGQRKTSI